MPEYLVCLLAAMLVCISVLSPNTFLSQKTKLSLVVLLTLLVTAYGFFSLKGVAILSIAGTCMYCTSKKNLPPAVRTLAAIFALVLVFAISLNALPGFSKFHLDAPDFLGAATVPFKKDIGFAKCIVGLLLLIFWIKPIESGKQIAEKMQRALPFSVVFSLAIILTANQLGWSYDFKWYDFSLVFIASFCLSAVAEEVLFRAIFQHRLHQYLQSYTRYAGIISLLSVAMTFGALHFSGGVIYALLAALSGLAYGWIYWRFKSLHGAIICHLLVNTTHFVFLLYPR